MRLALGELVSRAQSRGECPGVRRTLRRGFVGMLLCVGGGAREDEEGGPRLGMGARAGGGIKPAPFVTERVGWTGFKRGGPLTPPEAR